MTQSPQKENSLSFSDRILPLSPPLTGVSARPLRGVGKPTARDLESLQDSKKSRSEPIFCNKSSIVTAFSDNQHTLRRLNENLMPAISASGSTRGRLAGFVGAGAILSAELAAIRAGCKKGLDSSRRPKRCATLKDPFSAVPTKNSESFWASFTDLPNPLVRASLSLKFLRIMLSHD